MVFFYKTSISCPRGTAGWLWNFRLGDVGRWHDSDLLSLGGPPGHNELGLQLEESTSCFQNKKTDSEAAGHHERQLVHPMLSPGGPGYDRRRLTSVPGPGACKTLHDFPGSTRKLAPLFRPLLLICFG
jgi:hypothetical protein